MINRKVVHRTSEVGNEAVRGCEWLCVAVSADCLATMYRTDRRIRCDIQLVVRFVVDGNVGIFAFDLRVGNSRQPKSFCSTCQLFLISSQA